MAYVLIHVLDAVVPGQTLGSDPTVLVETVDTDGARLDVVEQFEREAPMPTTKGGTNIRVIVNSRMSLYVTVRDSDGVKLGLVVIPVDSLQPGDIWNVWYALDEAPAGAKLHVLLQYMPDQEESSALHVIRSQDFLLRALLLLQGPDPAPPEEQVADGMPMDVNRRMATKAVEESALKGAQLTQMEVAQKRMLQAHPVGKLLELMQALGDDQRTNRELAVRLNETGRRHGLETAQERQQARDEAELCRQVEEACSKLEQEHRQRGDQVAQLQRHRRVLEKCVSASRSSGKLVSVLQREMDACRLEIHQHLRAREALQPHCERLQAQCIALSEQLRAEQVQHRTDLEQANVRALGEKQRTQLLEHTLQDYDKLVAARKQEQEDEELEQEQLLWEVCAKEKELGCLWSTLEREREQRKQLEAAYDAQHTQPFVVQLEEGCKNGKIARDTLQHQHSLRQDFEQGQPSRHAAQRRAQQELRIEEQRLAELEAEDVLSAELHAHVQSLEQFLESTGNASRHLLEDSQELMQLHLDPNPQPSVDEAAMQAEHTALRRHLEERIQALERQEQLVDKQQVDLDQLADVLAQSAEAEAIWRETSAALWREREGVDDAIDQANARLKGAEVSQDDLQNCVQDKDSEIQALMKRVQELSSDYAPVKGDQVDQVLAKWINAYRPAVPFFRLGPGQYLFGRRSVLCSISNGKPVFRVGGGYVAFDSFLERYASDELESLLQTQRAAGYA